MVAYTHIGDTMSFISLAEQMHPLLTSTAVQNSYICFKAADHCQVCLWIGCNNGSKLREVVHVLQISLAGSQPDHGCHRLGGNH